MPTITSRQNPIVARYRAAARGEEPDQMLLDGAHLVGEALAAGVALAETAVTVAAAESPTTCRTSLSALGAGECRSRHRVAGRDGCAEPGSHVVRNRCAGASARCQTSTPIYAAPSPLVVIAIDIQDPGNLGAIVRVAEAAGATGVIAAGACADPFGWKALRGSMGSAFRLPIVISRDAPPTPSQRRGAAAAASSRRCRAVGRSLFDATLTGALAILVGGEGAGVSQALIDGADERVTIPMQAPVESLNTAVAAALVLYEAAGNERSNQQQARPRRTRHNRGSRTMRLRASVVTLFVTKYSHGLAVRRRPTEDEQ